MIIKLSDYMLEQAVSDAEVSDIALEQYSAMYDVNMAIANANIKRYMMEAYSGIYQEGEETKPKRTFKQWIGDVWAKIVDAVKTFFGWIADKWKQFINWISGKKVEAVAKKAEELDKKLTDREKEALAEEIVKNNKFVKEKFIRIAIKKARTAIDALTPAMDEFAGKIDSGVIFKSREIDGICRKIEKAINEHCTELDNITEKLISGAKSGGAMFSGIDDIKVNGDVDVTKISNAKWTEIMTTLAFLKSVDFKNDSKVISDKCEELLNRFKKASEKIKSGLVSKVDYKGDNDEYTKPYYGAAQDNDHDTTGPDAKWFGDKNSEDSSLVDLNGPEVKRLTDLIAKLQKIMTGSISRITDTVSTITKACGNVFTNVENEIKKANAAGKVDSAVASRVHHVETPEANVKAAQPRTREQDEAMKAAARNF